MKLISFLLLLFFIPFSSVNSKLPDPNIETNRWLVIFSGYKSGKKALTEKKKIAIETEILHSDNYENLNPGWFILAKRYVSERAAQKASKSFQRQKYENYVKYAGHHRKDTNKFEDHVKLITSDHYLVLAEGGEYDFSNRQSELFNHGTPMDVLSEIRDDELPQGVLPWRNKSIRVVSPDGTITRNVKIEGFYIFSRIQIETYRPPWVMIYVDEIDTTSEATIIDYVQHQSNHLIIAKLDVSDGAFAMDEDKYIPEFYQELDIEELPIDRDKIIRNSDWSITWQESYNAIPEDEKWDKEIGIKNWYESTHSEIEWTVYSTPNDTLVVLSAAICDSPCGGYIEQSTFFIWRWTNGKLIQLNAPDWLLTSMLRFKGEDDPFLFFINNNITFLKQLNRGIDISLPFCDEDPWEC